VLQCSNTSFSSCQQNYLRHLTGLTGFTSLQNVSLKKDCILRKTKVYCVRMLEESWKLCISRIYAFLFFLARWGFHFCTIITCKNLSQILEMATDSENEEPHSHSEVQTISYNDLLSDDPQIHIKIENILGQTFGGKDSLGVSVKV